MEYNLYIHIYQGAPTVSLTDGTLVSESVGNTTLNGATLISATSLIATDPTKMQVGITSVIDTGGNQETITPTAYNPITGVYTVSAMVHAHESGVAITTASVPISFTLNATENQISDPLKLAIRCDSGYQTSSGVNTVITPTGANANKWALSLDGNTWEAFGDPLTITSQITPVNYTLYVKSKAVDTEIPNNDISTKLQITAQIEAV